MTSSSLVILGLGALLALSACASPETLPSATVPAPGAAEPAPPESSIPSLTATPWTLASLDGQPVNAPADRGRPTLAFDAKTLRVSGLAAVNRYSGTYEAGDTTLKFGPLLATKMAGPPELNALETRFLRALEQTTAWRIDRGELELSAGDRKLARFTAAR